MSAVNSGRTVLPVAGFVLTLMVMGGCAKSGGSGSSAGAQSDPALVAAGKAVFDSNGCVRCHVVGGHGGRMGPDLTRVGADPTHTPEWLAQHVKNPKSQNPGSRMPAFEGRISDKDLLALGAYLAGLK